MTIQKKWFESWFDTHYYHILYRHRDNKEAQKFIKNLVQFLKIGKEQRILDLACGKGRHAVYLNQLGFNTTGVDLSKKNIDVAKKYSNSNLDFKIHDMRLPMKSKFDLILNMFTSFGYFDSLEDDHKVLKSIKESLNVNGIGVIDFMNVPNVVEKLIPINHYNIKGIEFKIERFFDGEFITKKIRVEDGGSIFNFKERVRAFGYDDFKSILMKNNLKILASFGSYDLEPYDEKKSTRLILIFNID